MRKLKESAPFAEIKRAINALIEAVESLRIMTSDTVKVRRTTKGTMLEAAVKPGKDVPESTGMKFKGEYVSGKLYQKGDVVVVRGGSTAGTYICQVDTTAGTPAPQDPPQDPEQGIFWIQIAPGYTIGQWT